MYLPNQTMPRRRRSWLTEALIVAAVLAFGGFALLSDARLSPTEFANSISEFVGR